MKRLHAILKDADLEKTTVKNIQKQLESDLDINLSDRKQFIRDEVRARSSAGTGRFSPARPDRAEGARARRGSDASRRGVARSPDRGGARFSPAGRRTAFFPLDSRIRSDPSALPRPLPPRAGREVPQERRPRRPQEVRDRFPASRPDPTPTRRRARPGRERTRFNKRSHRRERPRRRSEKIARTMDASRAPLRETTCSLSHPPVVVVVAPFERRPPRASSRL